MNVVHVFSFSGSQAVCLPICLLRPFNGRGTGKADSCRHLSDVVAFYGMMDWPKLTDWRGRSDLFFCFDFLRRLISKWVGCNPAADVKSRAETTRYAYRLSSLLRHAWLTLAPILASVVIVTSPKCKLGSISVCVCIQFDVVYCWLFVL